MEIVSLIKITSLHPPFPHEKFRHFPVCLLVSLVLGSSLFLARAVPMPCQRRSRLHRRPKQISPRSKRRSRNSVFDYHPGRQRSFLPAFNPGPAFGHQLPMADPLNLVSQLKGFPDAGRECLASINNRNMAAGETADVTPLNGATTLTATEIKKLAMIIRWQVEFEPIEVFLPRTTSNTPRFMLRFFARQGKRLIFLFAMLSRHIFPEAHNRLQNVLNAQTHFHRLRGRTLFSVCLNGGQGF